ncbi:ComEC/Rec2 family competence protein [Flavobacterium suzhouense]|uniref:ComEC/Rec2 family competence protein n=1 Tax=Flavobacterium suzhouense TaxID=1529638 RepID=A0ABW5NS08_9FLAO
MKYPIGIITFFLALGIIAGHYFGLAQNIAFLIVIVAITLLIVSFWLSKRTFTPTIHFSVVVLFFSFCFGLSIQSVHFPPNHKLHYTHFIHSGNPIIKGYVSERLKPNDYQERYYFEITSVNQNPVNGKILLTVARDSTQNNYPHPGDSFIIADNPSPISKPLNPDQFNYASYMEKQGIFHQLKLKDNFIRTGTITKFDYYLGNFRERLINSFKTHHYSPQVQNTLNALLLGQRQDMDSTTNNAYKNAGVLHILAISGLHFSVLFYLLTILFKPFNRFKKHGRILRFLSIIIIIWGFAFITGLSASVIRSVVMFTIISLGQYLNRDTNIYNSVFISMLILLVANPYFIFDAGFQLSYLAVFAIIWLESYYRKFSLSKHKPISYITDIISISLAAQIGVFPLSLYYFNQFPLLFLVANIIVIPLSNIILILGLFVLLLNFIWTDAALIAGKALELLVIAMNSFINWIASFERFVIKEISFTLLLTLLLYVVIAFFCFWLYKKSYRNTIALLFTILIFQGAYSITTWKHNQDEEFIVFNNRKSTTITLKSSKQLTVLSNDSTALSNAAIKAYSRAGFATKIEQKPLQNVLWFSQKKILIIDSCNTYLPNLKSEIIILSGSPKINLERAINDLQPKEIIADATNYKSYIKRWKQTCIKQKIPFHATAEKGYYSLK